MKKKTKQQQAEEELLEMLKRDGNIKCDKCSTPNWNVYHKPGDCEKVK